MSPTLTLLFPNLTTASLRHSVFYAHRKFSTFSVPLLKMGLRRPTLHRVVCDWTCHSLLFKHNWIWWSNTIKQCYLYLRLCLKLNKCIPYLSTKVKRTYLYILTLPTQDTIHVSIGKLIGLVEFWMEHGSFPCKIQVGGSNNSIHWTVTLHNHDLLK